MSLRILYSGLVASRITFADIAAKLKVDSSEDAEHIVAKVGQDMNWQQ